MFPRLTHPSFTIGAVLAHKNSFATWMNKVSAIIDEKIGMSTLDLPDQPYTQWFEEKVSPTSAAKRAIRGICE
jgi:hypothetical protein